MIHYFHSTVLNFYDIRTHDVLCKNVGVKLRIITVKKREILTGNRNLIIEFVNNIIKGSFVNYVFEFGAL